MYILEISESMAEELLIGSLKAECQVDFFYYY